MPEGHTIHRLARDLNRSFRDSKIRASSPQGRFDDGAKKLDRQTCAGFEAFGKHLIGHFGGGDVLHVHLGLIGKFRKAKGDPVGAVRLRLSHDDTHWDLRGPMVCTVGTPDLADDVAGSVGPDPLRRNAKPDEFIAGIGNVYRAELLFLAGIDPETPANALDDAELETIWQLTVQQLRLGERLNRIVTVDPDAAGYKNARAIPAGERLYVYKRDDVSCRNCETPIALLEVGGRKMWKCPQCQK